jgi:putative two-component system response regulator
MADAPFQEKRRARRERRARPRLDSDRRGRHDTIFNLARVAELRDRETGGHVKRIRCIVEVIARRLGHPDPEGLGCDAMLHDVGKLVVPYDILRKPGQLTDEERDVMRAHTVHGQRFLGRRSGMGRAARIARSHHEHWDGSGYPDGLAGDAIPIEARITAAADVLDALVADRCYKQPWSYRQAVNRVRSLRGTVLDPAIVDAVLFADADGSLLAIFHHGM